MHLRNKQSVPAHPNLPPWGGVGIVQLGDYRYVRSPCNLLEVEAHEHVLFTRALVPCHSVLPALKFGSLWQA
jgi:hypothetical protein